LRKIEVEVQEKWEADKIYETQPKTNPDGSPREKFLVTFPYPYMNGRLHLGHAFSFTKAEFTARYQRLLGKNALFPFGFHCTGMPIQAAANKLKDEIAAFGCPPVFPDDLEEMNMKEDKKPPKEEKSIEATVGASKKGQKSKLVAKGMAGRPLRQWEILEKMVPRDEIPSFAEPMKWLEYFPPYGASDLQAFGACIDWRRSFITTSVNPFYNSFIRWQFHRLREGGKVKFGKRANIYCPLDTQVCADHDRASGEGVGPQEYTLIKLEVLHPFPTGGKLASCPALENKRVFLAPATLRAETMYGQTNCFVLPDGDYGCFETTGGDIMVVSQRAANGMAHQGLTPQWGVAPNLCPLKGTDLIGLPLKAPNAVYERIYTLPLMTISMGKGTGVVTSVPSDAPDDYAALRELKEKPLWREKFGLTAEMVEPFDVVPIIDIPGYGSTSAVTMCERLNIKSYKDTELLKKAKEEVYLKGFYEGIMVVGECKGMKVCDAKPVIRASLIASGDAIAYFEPESLVMSRRGAECVVALTDQWYLSYGEEEWMNTVLNHVKSTAFNPYNDKILEKFDFVLHWLKEWACSRQFGLGTQLPWDEQWVIESLSDSTIYMAYYTVAHHFHGAIDNLSGLKGAPCGLDPSQVDSAVWDHIFLAKDAPAGHSVPRLLLDQMRAEFEYWYPMDLRVSAKDLIPNHLTMSLYNHIEIWKDRPELWPKGIYCNGHIMVDAEKMAKSKGNFLTLLQCVQDYGADATRFACADGGDSMEDANFDRKTANAAILNLFTEHEWLSASLADAAGGKLRTGEMHFNDRALINDVFFLVRATAVEFDSMRYRDGLQKCWYAMCISRDSYRDWAYRSGSAMHAECVATFARALVVMICPICPHWSESLWPLVRGLDVLGGPSTAVSAVDAPWPQAPECDTLLRKKSSFFRDLLRNLRQTLTKTKAKLKGDQFTVNIVVTAKFEADQVSVLEFLALELGADGFPDDVLKRLQAFTGQRPDWSKKAKLLMQFGAFMIKEAKERGADALVTEAPFDQSEILRDNENYLLRSLQELHPAVSTVAIHGMDEPDFPSRGLDKKVTANCKPLAPSFNFAAMK
jgi:leucyl-tRNA synthetase